MNLPGCTQIALEFKVLPTLEFKTPAPRSDQNVNGPEASKKPFLNTSQNLWKVSYMGVSENSGTPKSSILIKFSIINHPFWGTPIFGNAHIGNLLKALSVRIGHRKYPRYSPQKLSPKSTSGGIPIKHGDGCLQLPKVGQLVLPRLVLQNCKNLGSSCEWFLEEDYRNNPQEIYIILLCLV